MPFKYFAVNLPWRQLPSVLYILSYLCFSSFTRGTDGLERPSQTLPLRLCTVRNFETAVDNSGSRERIRSSAKYLCRTIFFSSSEKPASRRRMRWFTPFKAAAQHFLLREVSLGHSPSSQLPIARSMACGSPCTFSLTESAPLSSPPACSTS
ncbi:hypothetical protein KC19_VG103500 [Ceratodon purpureus]|uniref:Uncharacterized protein n=1 Tax=Ceratodon purpureus TaxID=3225 RepID=A0A8T0HNY2_CERPU|nr:hypothetical protein KC19_VG103500 [Ceratodon purpureus]